MLSRSRLSVRERSIPPAEKSNMRCLTEVNGNIWCGSDNGILVFNPNEKKIEKIINFDFQRIVF